MGSRYGKWTEARIAKFQKEGRGKGIGATYRPWIEVHDLSSRGDSRRVFSKLTNRSHHLLSGIEFDFFVLAEFTPDVVDIREQYPLDREITRSIAAELCVAHPRYPDTGVDTVMTCDFLITRQRGSEKTLEAYNCKSASEADNLRSLEKLEIQRRYFKACDVPHFLVFAEKLPSVRVKNIQWIRNGLLAEGETESVPGYLDDHCSRLIRDIGRATTNASLSEYCQRYDERTGAQPGTALRVVRILLWQRSLVTDLNQPSLHATPISMFRAATVGLRAVGGT